MSSSAAAPSPTGLAASRPEGERGLHLKLAILAVLLWGSLLREVNLERTWGWDESMHAELPAARMVELVRAGEWRGACEVALECDRYPFVVPVYLAAVQLATGISEVSARTALATLWCLGLVAGVFVVRRLVGARPRARAGAALVALLAAFASIARLYAPTLFLEASFAAVLSFVLLAWLRRGDPGAGRGADLAAGVLLALAFFTKFNYALLLGLGLALDAACELAASARARRARATLARLGWVAAPAVLAGAWWFVLPLPAGPALGASHREAFLSFLAGNQGFAPTPWSHRLLDWTSLAVPFGTLLIALVGLGRALRAWRETAMRACWLVALALVVPISLHPFHLDRFLLPAVTPLWFAATAGLLMLGEGASLRLGDWRRVASGVGLIAASIAASLWWQRHALGVLGLASPDPAVRAYQEAQLGARALVTRHDPLPTNGLRRAEASRLLDLVAQAAGPSARLGWIGMSSELSPAVVHLGLRARGGSRERFLADSPRDMDVAYEGLDPNWSREQLAAFASGFDVIFATDPPDLTRRPNRAFTARYRRALVEELGWSEEELGSVEIRKDFGPPYPVRLLACRPPKR